MDETIDVFLPSYSFANTKKISSIDGSETSSFQALKKTFDMESVLSSPKKKMVSFKTRHLRQKLSSKSDVREIITSFHIK